MDGKTMIRAYDGIYLEDAMQNFAVMMDYGSRVCHGGMDGFYDRLLASDVVRQFETGNPRYLVGMSGIDLATQVIVSTGEPCGTITYILGPRSDIFWTGWSSAYLQWYTATSFENLRRLGLSAGEVRRMYPTFHEADLSKFTETALDIIARRREAEGSPLKRQRKLAGFTQTELAGRSGVSLRMIQAYEQLDQDISKAEAGALHRLAIVLGCDISLLLS